MDMKCWVRVGTDRRGSTPPRLSAWLKVPGDMIQAAGRWHSGAYLRYLRETRDNAVGMLTQLAGADTDDLEADFVAVDAHDFNEEDVE